MTLVIFDCVGTVTYPLSPLSAETERGGRRNS